MHLGLFSAQYNKRYSQLDESPGNRTYKARVLTNKNWRSLIQSGVACWMSSWASSAFAKCCDLKNLGGDGTAIGIPVSSFDFDNKAAWIPPGGDRTTKIPRKQDFTVVRDSGARAVLSKLTASGVTHVQLSALGQEWANVRPRVPDWVASAVARWLELPVDSAERRPLRTVLNLWGTPYPVNISIPPALAFWWLGDELQGMLSQQGCTSLSVVQALQRSSHWQSKGVGPEIIAILQAQDVPDPSTVTWITKIGT